MKVDRLVAGDLVWVSTYGIRPIFAGAYAVVTGRGPATAELITAPGQDLSRFNMYQPGATLVFDEDDGLVLANDEPKAWAALAAYRLKGDK